MIDEKNIIFRLIKFVEFVNNFIELKFLLLIPQNENINQR